MGDRIAAWLDGELPLEALTPREQAEARALQATIRAAANRINRTPAPDLTGRVMDALPPAPAQPVRQSAPWRFRAWLGSLVPRPGTTLRPALAMAAAALVIGFGLGRLGPGSGPADGVPAVAADPSRAQVFVRFEFEATGATDVRLAGSFTDWEARHDLTPLGDQRWAVTVPLEPGVHDYVFVVDDERYVVDPYAPRVPDGFGGYNSRLALLTPER